MKKKLSLGFILIIIAGMFWGTTGITAKTVIQNYGLMPMAVGALRIFICAPLLLAIAYFKNKDSFKKLFSKKKLILF